ncbi:hypothetical protein [Arthrobacter sp. H14]|nr:hypothetical protein [Arthrobacter sp. H14]
MTGRFRMGLPKKDLADSFFGAVLWVKAVAVVEELIKFCFQGG